MGAGRRNQVVRWLDLARELLAHPVVPFPRRAISAELAATFGGSYLKATTSDPTGRDWTRLSDLLASPCGTGRVPH